MQEKNFTSNFYMDHISELEVKFFSCILILHIYLIMVEKKVYIVIVNFNGYLDIMSA